ncbi:type IV pilus biogenesis protein PilM [Oceanobacillus sp. CAU 1775]
MFSFKKQNSVIHLFIEDHILRIVETNGRELKVGKICDEIVLPNNVIENGRIVDELEFFQFMKDVVQQYGLKNKSVRFNVPNAMVIMRQIEVPTNYQGKKEILEFIEMEIGKSIHFPFRDPIIDFPNPEGQEDSLTNENRLVTIFAAPGDEMRKYTEVFHDVNLKPISADVGILGVYRYLNYHHQLNADDVYLVVEFNVGSIHLGIFHQHRLEFLRYQDLDMELDISDIDPETNQRKWKFSDDKMMVSGMMEDEVTELERIMNFYRFSLHRGEKQVTDIAFLGDYPFLDEIEASIRNRYEEITVTKLEIKTARSKSDERIENSFIPALGLAIRGGLKDASRS